MPADFFDTLEPGERIVVRFRLAGSSPGNDDDAPAARGPLFSDVIGFFASLEDGVLTVDTASGPVSVERAGITHAKRVPPAPQRRASRRR
ncbi:hypothetical protein [Arthrobacter sp.]|uniref:hypothetical protein n=1 Tax=Arthrobacter sp. TaxID=1667 RepID=UPI003A8F6B69